MSKGWFVYAEPVKHNEANNLCFLLNLCKYNVGGVNYRTTDM